MANEVPTNLDAANRKHHTLREIANTRHHATLYENTEATVATGQTAYDWATTASGFSTIGCAVYASIRTDQTITVKFNSTDNDGITIASTDSPYEIEGLEITNIYVAAVAEAAVKIFLM